MSYKEAAEDLFMRLVDAGITDEEWNGADVVEVVDKWIREQGVPTELPLLASLEIAYMNGFPDEQTGHMDAPTGHWYRVGRHLVNTNSQGFKTLHTFITEEGAARAFLQIDEEYSSWDDDDAHL